MRSDGHPIVPDVRPPFIENQLPVEPYPHAVVVDDGQPIPAAAGALMNRGPADAEVLALQTELRRVAGPVELDRQIGAGEEGKANSFSCPAEVFAAQAGQRQRRARRCTRLLAQVSTPGLLLLLSASATRSRYQKTRGAAASRQLHPRIGRRRGSASRSTQASLATFNWSTALVSPPLARRPRPRRRPRSAAATDLSTGSSPFARNGKPTCG